jgi:peptidoglycan/LPS O-acetylase OafA/YrhL
MLHFWSLGVEEQFYLIWPGCVWLFGRSHERLARICLVGCAIAIPTRWLLMSIYGDASAVVQTNTFARMDSLLAGAFSSIVIRNSWMLSRFRRWMPWIAMLAFAGIVAIERKELVTRGFYTQLIEYSLLAWGFTTLVLWAYWGDGTGNLLDRFLRLAPLRSMGRYSYGIYVYHVAVFYAVRLAFVRYIHVEHPQIWRPILGVGFSCLIAYASFHLVESRFLLLKRYFRAQRTAVSRDALIT